MPRMAYHLVGKPINSFADCDEDLKEHFRCYFTHWANNHMADAKKLTDEELEDAVDENVFEFWNSSDPLQAPRFVKPKMTEMMVQIGVFKKDLPNPRRDPDFYDHTGTCPDAWADAASEIQGRSSGYKAPPERKAHQPAFVAANLDDLQQTVIHEFLDKKGRRVPATYIDFRNDDNEPQDRLMAKAYNRSDRAWTNAWDDWNKQLCVYLCRRQLFNSCHTEPWNGLVEGENRFYSEEDFHQAAQIIDEISAIRDRLQNRVSYGHTETEIRGKHGIHIFQAKD